MNKELSEEKVAFLLGSDMYISSENIVFMKKMKGVGLSYELIKKQSSANIFNYMCISEIVSFKSLFKCEKIYFNMRGENSFVLLNPNIKINGNAKKKELDFAFYKMKKFLFSLECDSLKKAIIVEDFLRFSLLFGYIKTITTLNKIILESENKSALINSLLKILYEKIKIEFLETDGCLSKKIDIIVEKECHHPEFVITFGNK